MSSTIGSVSNISSLISQSIARRERPDPSKMAEVLFSKIDSGGKGYIEKTDLESAFQKVSSASGTSANADDVFSSLDSDGDGKVTKQEMSDGIKKLADALDSQFQSMRMSGAMPPPPPRDGNDAGFTKDELQSQLSEIGSSDSKRANLISSIVGNFDKVDTDGDGKVSFKEAMAFDKSNSAAAASSSTSSGSTDSTGAAASTGTSNSDAQLMLKIMQLMAAYGGVGDNGGKSSLSVTA